MASPPLTVATASRLLRVLPATSSALLPSRGLKIPKTPPQFDIKNMPAKHRLPVMPRTPTLFLNAGVKIPKGTKDLYRIQGEELVHNKLILGQFGIVAVSGGQMKHQHFEILRYITYVVLVVKSSKPLTVLLASNCNQKHCNHIIIPFHLKGFVLLGWR